MHRNAPHGRQNAARRRVDEVVRVVSSLTGDGSEQFADDVRRHMGSMPSRYRSDMQADRAGDVLMHMNLLQAVRVGDGKLPAFNVRAVTLGVQEDDSNSLRNNDEGFAEISMSPTIRTENGLSSTMGQANGTPVSLGSLGRPTFGSYTDLSSAGLTRLGSMHASPTPTDALSDLSLEQEGTRFEITFADRDRPRRLHLMSRCLGEIGLDICEAHAFSTHDRYLLNVFVCSTFEAQDCGHDEISEESLTAALEAEIRKIDWVIGRMMPEGVQQQQQQAATAGDEGNGVAANGISNGASGGREVVENENHGEIDTSKLVKGQLIASGTFGRLHRGTYGSREVAIKYLKTQKLTDTQLAEFKGEVSIMKQVAHPNVLRLVGANTEPPELCIVTEFMEGGSINQFRRQKKYARGMPSALFVKSCIDIARGMHYLHQHNIVHRDLKGANLLIARDGSVRVADFGVARIIDMGGTMTAETGTYRWMAPEIISHQAYDVRCDVYSFGVVMWELWTGHVPYSDLTPMQAAVGVVQRGLRPKIPRDMPREIAQIMESCWAQKADMRPFFENIVTELEAYETRQAHALAPAQQQQQQDVQVPVKQPDVTGGAISPASEVKKKRSVLGGLKRMFSSKSKQANADKK